MLVLKDYIEFDSLSPYSKRVTVNSFDGKRLNDVIDYLKNLGLEYTEFGSRADSKDTDKNNNKSVFKGKLSLNDLKQI